jgi:hypothetical protein
MHHKMYILTFVHRAHSSGNQSISTKSFHTLDSVSKFLQDEWYDDQFDYWDEDDMGCSQPTKDDFAVSQLETKLGRKRQVELYGPYSQYACLVPDEVILTSEVDIKTKEEPVTDKYVKNTLGEYDYERLEEMNSELIASLQKPDSKYDNLIIELNKLIKNSELLLMDKESGSAFECSGVIGYVNGKLMLFNER